MSIKLTHEFILKHPYDNKPEHIDAKKTDHEVKYTANSVRRLQWILIMFPEIYKISTQLIQLSQNEILNFFLILDPICMMDSPAVQLLPHAAKSPQGSHLTDLGCRRNTCIGQFTAGFVDRSGSVTFLNEGGSDNLSWTIEIYTIRQDMLRWNRIVIIEKNYFVNI